MRSLYLLIGFMLLCSFSDTSLIKRISDVQYRYEFYTTTKKITPKAGRNYYWFKGGAIHNAETGTAGELLHDGFQKYYHSNQLAEAGKFKNGLKEGYWKTWYENGVLQSETYWDSGQKDGVYYSYDQTGLMVEKGNYRNNIKNGRWINYIAKDTLKYRDGKIVVKKRAEARDTITAGQARPGFFKRMFKAKKDAHATDAPTAKNKSVEKPAQKDTPVAEKKGLFKKVFGKKDKQATEHKVIDKKPASRKSNKAENTSGKKSFFARLFSKKSK